MVVRIMYGIPTQWARNPWLNPNSKLASAVRMGLARPKKELVFKNPPPWYARPEALSDAQKAQVERFARVASQTKGMSVVDRIRMIKEQASGPTGVPSRRYTRKGRPQVAAAQTRAGAGTSL